MAPSYFNASPTSLLDLASSTSSLSPDVDSLAAGSTPFDRSAIVRHTDRLVRSSLHELTKRANPRIIPNQRNTYSIVAIVIFFVFGFVFWHLPVVRDMVAAIKLLVVGWHELCHLIVGVLCGGEVEFVCIDPNLGGRVQFSRLLRTVPRSVESPGGRIKRTITQDYWSMKALVTLSAGYIGSELLGGGLIMVGFDITASKIASFFIGVGMLVPLAVVDHWVPIVSIVLTEGLMIGLWWGSHGEALRYFILFIGTLNLFYVVWDVSDERFFDKPNPSDCSQLEELIGGSATFWTIWTFLWAVLVLSASVIGGIALFKHSPEEVYQRAKEFLPT